MSSESESTARNKESGIGAGRHPKRSFSRNQGAYDVQNFCTSNQYLTLMALFSFFINSRDSKDSSWAALSSAFSVVYIPSVNSLQPAALCPFFAIPLASYQRLCASCAEQHKQNWPGKIKPSIHWTQVFFTLHFSACPARQSQLNWQSF